MTYDLIVVGGGVAGSSLAARVSASGVRVLLVERDSQSADRVRGEALQPWGVADVRKLGVAEVLRPIAAELRYFDQILRGQLAGRRDLPVTNMSGEPMWGFYHPDAQERLLAHAAAAGAEVRRGVAVEDITPGARPTVRIGASDEVEARLVAVCAGRNPGLRTRLGFTVRRGTIPLFLSGVWLHDLPPGIDDAAYVPNDVRTGAVAGLFPQPGRRARAYFGFHPDACPRLQGASDFTRFRELFLAAAGDAIPFGNPTPAGPLASFECADVWVDQPYRDGVALVGDAASSNDPSWGQGLSLAFRDARVLSDELLADADWNAAAARYARRHDEYYGAVRTVSGWFYDLFQALGPEADARRARALPLIGQDPTRIPDVLFSGPEFPIDAHS